MLSDGVDICRAHFTAYPVSSLHIPWHKTDAALKLGGSETKSWSALIYRYKLAILNLNTMPTDTR